MDNESEDLSSPQQAKDDSSKEPSSSEDELDDDIELDDSGI